MNPLALELSGPFWQWILVWCLGGFFAGLGSVLTKRWLNR